MQKKLIDLLDDGDLRDYAGREIFRRGVSYFRNGRVDIDLASDDEARCRVRGPRHYFVSLWNYHDELGATCTCPHAASGWFCKHMVAAAFAVKEYLQQSGASSWQTILSNTIDPGTSRTRTKQNKPYWLFLSLAADSDGWKFTPCRLWVDRIPAGVLPTDHTEIAANLPDLVHHNHWILEHIKTIRSDIVVDGCINAGSEAIAVVKLLLEQEKKSSNYFYDYYYNASYPLAEYFSILAKVGLPVYVGDSHNPARSLVSISSQPAKLVLKITQDAENIILTMAFAQGETIKTLAEAETIDMLTSKDTNWVRVGANIFELDSDLGVDRLLSWLHTPQIMIPHTQEDEFLEIYFPRLAQQLPIIGDNIQWETVAQPPVNRLYLTDEDGELQAHLRFGYAEYELEYHAQAATESVRRKDSSWTLARIQRDLQQEDIAYSQVSSARHGLKRSGKQYPDHVFLLRARVDPLDFLMRHVPRLVAAGFEIYGEEKLKSARVNRNKPTLSLNVSSGIDWFDVQAVVQFGDVEATLKEIRRALKRKERYVKLADGTIGEIPSDWIQRYKHLFGLGEQTEDGVRLANHHLTLLDQLLAEADQAQSDPEFDRRKQRLLAFDGIQPQALPAGFQGELRPYQKAGYDWLHFLHEYEFGGCLADDMGLGKTVETLVFLQSLKETGHHTAATLLVLPRSLLINWERETARFTPNLKILYHFGNERAKNVKAFDAHDLVLTTYGTMLRDVRLLRKYRFHYLVLDESQAIKNPLSKTSKAARLLNSDHRLVLTGTPVENSTFELWSQFAFLNPGLLGNLEYFKSEFGNSIERQSDENASQLLRKMVYPFILRRTKDQVAPELPPRTERIIYSDMEPAQRKFYNKTRDYYRAMLLGVIEEQGMNHARLKVLEGLLRLRQISNHPKLVQETFRGDSSKLLLLLETLETLQSEGHKALIFSQFVSMLKIVRAELDQRKIPYVYLDGRTRKRQERVDQFQTDETIPFFLISLKAGGVGLNLTAADYVIHIDPWWNPAVEMQATDRTHRIGQDKPVFVYKLITRDSVEEKILQLQERKKALVEQLITTESSFFKSITTDDVRALFS